MCTPHLKVCLFLFVLFVVLRCHYNLFRLLVLTVLWVVVTVTIINTETSSTCGVRLLPGCTCSNFSNSTINVFCNRISLGALPSLDFGRVAIHSLNLEGNNLAKIDTGDFFGIKVERLLLGNNSLSQLDLLSFWGLEYHLTTLDLSFNHIKRIPSDALKLLRRLKSLSLTGNQIRTVHKYDFMNLNHLEVLSLDKNPITVIEDEAFRGTTLLLLVLDRVNLSLGLQGIPTTHLSSLKSLSIASSGLREIPEGWFTGLPALTSVNLDDNYIQEIPDTAFQGLQNTLETLEINGNKLKRLPRAALRMLPMLESLEASNNRLRRLYPRSFNESSRLERLDLSHNAIKDISHAAFEGMKNIRTIDLRSNQLITLYEDTFEWPDSRLREVYLAQNNWLCNCLMKWLKNDYKKRRKRVEIFADLKSMKCARPDYLAKRPIVRVAAREFTCDHDYYYYYDDYDYQ